MVNSVVISILAVIFYLSLSYVIKKKAKGFRCIGCPNNCASDGVSACAGGCEGKCNGCAGSCSCS